MMTVSEAVSWTTYLLSGLIFYMSGFVVLLHLRAWRADQSRILPLHVWLIAVSYNLLVVSLLTGERDFEARFWIYGPALVIGVYSLWVLSREQRDRARRSS